MEIKDFEDLISNLNMVDVSLKQNLQKLEKIDIEKQLSDIAVENIGKNLTYEFQKQLTYATQKIEEQNHLLIEKIDLFTKTTGDLLQIDNIAESVEIIVKGNRKLQRSYKVIPALAIAFSVGLFTFLTANFNNIYATKIANEREIVKNYPSITFQKINGKFYLLIDKKELKSGFQVVQAMDKLGVSIK